MVVIFPDPDSDDEMEGSPAPSKIVSDSEEDSGDEMEGDIQVSPAPSEIVSVKKEDSDVEMEGSNTVSPSLFQPIQEAPPTNPETGPRETKFEDLTKALQIKGGENPLKRPPEFVEFVDKAKKVQKKIKRPPLPIIELKEPRNQTLIFLNYRELIALFKDIGLPATEENSVEIAGILDEMCNGNQIMKERVLYTFDFMEEESAFAKAINTLLRDPAMWKEMLFYGYNTQMLWLKIYINTRNQAYVFYNAPMINSSNTPQFQDLMEYTLFMLTDKKRELLAENYVKELAGEWPEYFRPSDYTDYKIWLVSWYVENSPEKIKRWFQLQIIDEFLPLVKDEEKPRKATPPKEVEDKKEAKEESFFTSWERKKLQERFKKELSAMKEKLPDRILKAIGIFGKIKKTAAEGCMFDSTFYTNTESSIIEFDSKSREITVTRAKETEIVKACCGNGKTAFYLTKYKTDDDVKDPFILHSSKIGGDGLLIRNFEKANLNQDEAYGPFLCKNTTGVVVIAKTLDEGNAFANLYEQKEGQLICTKQWNFFRMAKTTVWSCTYDKKFDTLIVETKSKLIFVPLVGKHKTIKKPLGEGPYKYTIGSNGTYEVSNGEGSKGHEISQYYNNNHKEESIYFIHDSLHKDIMKNQFSLLILIGGSESQLHFFSPEGVDMQYYELLEKFKETDEYQLYDSEYKGYLTEEEEDEEDA